MFSGKMNLFNVVNNAPFPVETKSTNRTRNKGDGSHNFIQFIIDIFTEYVMRMHIGERINERH